MGYWMIAFEPWDEASLVAREFNGLKSEDMIEAALAGVKDMGKADVLKDMRKISTGKFPTKPKLSGKGVQDLLRILRIKDSPKGPVMYPVTGSQLKRVLAELFDVNFIELGSRKGSRKKRYIIALM